MSVLPFEIAAAFEQLLNFDVVEEDPVMSLAMKQFDPQSNGDVTLAMMKKNWPKHWKDAVAVKFHGGRRRHGKWKMGK